MLGALVTLALDKPETLEVAGGELVAGGKVGCTCDGRLGLGQE